MTRAIVNDHGTIRLATLDAVPGAQAADPVEVALVAADIQPKDRQTARGEMKLPLPPFFVAGSQAVGQLDDGSLVFVRGSLDAAGGLRDGVYAERFTAERDWLLPLPAGLDPVAAAAGTACLADALYALDDVARLQPGDTVLVLGSTSGVGAAAVSIALARGHSVVAATARPVRHRAARRARGRVVRRPRGDGARRHRRARRGRDGRQRRRGAHRARAARRGASRPARARRLPGRSRARAHDDGAHPHGGRAHRGQLRCGAARPAARAHRARRSTCSPHAPTSRPPSRRCRSSRASTPCSTDRAGRTVLLGHAYSCLDQVG